MATLVAASVALPGASSASAAVPHTVVPGDTLSSIAAENDLTTGSLAAYNGVSEDADVILGTTVDVPTADESDTAQPDSGDSGSSGGGDAYVVTDGDTLSQIAERVGTSEDELAALNGLDPDDLLPAGTVLELSGAGGDTSSSDAGDTGSSSFSSTGPEATGERVSSDEIIQVAEDHGVPGSLAAAIAWQESGFNNAVVSGADARGVMQIIPDTWDFVQNSLSPGPLSASSAMDNVHAGAMFLAYLLDQTGGDPELAAAAYYQGLRSVQSQGLLPETERYVASVTALRSRFGGP